MKPILTPQERQYVIDHAAEFTAKELAAKYKVKPQTIGCICKKAQVKTKPEIRYIAKTVEVTKHNFGWAYPSLDKYFKR